MDKTEDEDHFLLCWLVPVWEKQINISLLQLYQNRDPLKLKISCFLARDYLQGHVVIGQGGMASN